MITAFPPEGNVQRARISNETSNLREQSHVLRVSEVHISLLKRMIILVLFEAFLGIIKVTVRSDIDVSTSS